MYEARIRLVAALLLSFSLVEFLVFGGLGIAIPLIVLIFYSLTLWQGKGIKKEKISSKLLIPILLVTICFGLFDNQLLKGFNLLLLVGLILLHIGEVFEINPYVPYTIKWFIAILSLGFIKPFEEFGSAIRDAKKEHKEETKGKGEVVNKVVIGILISLPVVIVAGFLLMRADAAFEGMMDLITKNVQIDTFYIFTRTITVALLFIPCAGFFYGTGSRTSLTGEHDEDKVERDDVERVRWKLDFTVGLTACSLLGGLYIVYCVSQLSYFISAFSGILPSHFTYAEYARRGFFEMLPIACLNIGVIGVLNLLVKGKEERKKAIWIRNYSLFFMAFTVFIILTALSKMALYMGEYGLTIKRVYVTWFLILCLTSLVLIGISLFRTHFNLVKKLFIAFICLYLGLNYSNVDYLIARYNVSLHQATGAEVESSFQDLSLSAVGPYMEIQKGEHVDNDMYKYELEIRSNWENWNLARYHASQLLKEK